MRSEIRSRSTSANSAKERRHDLRLDVALALDSDVLLQRHEGDPGLGESVEDRHDLTQRPAEPRELADDQAVAAAEDARQLVEPPALLGRLPGGRQMFLKYNPLVGWTRTRRLVGRRDGNSWRWWERARNVRIQGRQLELRHVGCG